MQAYEMKIVDHKLRCCESARAVRKMSNRNQMTVPRCAWHMTAQYWITLQLFETFSTPNMGEGDRAVSGITTRRSTIASSSQFIQKPSLEHAILADRGFCKWIYFIQMLIQSRQEKRKSRKSHDSQINHARSKIIKFRNENQSQCVLSEQKTLLRSILS